MADFPCALHGERLATLEANMEQVVEGVSNFREFQADMRQFVTEFKTRKGDDEALTAKHNNRLTLILAGIAAVPAILEVVQILHALK